MVKQLQEGQRERLHEVMAANSNVLPATATKASATQDSSEFAAFCRHSGLGVRMRRPCKSVLRNWSRSSRLVKNTSLMRAAPLNQTCGIDFAQDFWSKACWIQRLQRLGRKKWLGEAHGSSCGECTPLWLLMDKKFCVTWWKMSPSECGPKLQGQWHAWLSIFFQSNRYCTHFHAELYCYCHCQWGRALHVRRKHSWILRARSLIWSLVLCPHLVASFKWCFLSFCEGRFQATVVVQIWGTV